MKGFDKNKIFSIDGIHKNENLESDIELIIRKMKDRIFNEDFPVFFDRFDKEMTRYSRYFYDKLLGELLSLKTSQPICLSSLYEQEYYKNLKHIITSYKNHLETLGIDFYQLSDLTNYKVLKLDFNVINMLYKEYHEQDEKSIKYFFKRLRDAYIYTGIKSKGFKEINDLIGNLEKDEYIRVFLSNNDEPAYVGKQSDMVDGIEVVGNINFFWAFCLRLNYVFFYPNDGKSLNNLHKIFTDIDDFKESCKTNSPSDFYNYLLDQTFCDEIKACLLTKYADFENKPDHILKMIENDYDVAFKKVNGISFQDYLMNDDFAEFNYKLERNQCILDILEIKNYQGMKP